ncbi:MAG: ABC transporter permease [Candidatus Methanomethylicaceae archaeon]
MIAGERSAFIRQSLLARRLILAAGLLALWHIFVVLFRVPPFLLPSPVSVVSTLFQDLISGRLLVALGNTLQLLIGGVALGLLGGVALATLSILSSWGKDLLSILTSVFNPLPGVAVLPLAMLWFGLTPAAIVFVIVYSAVWPMAISVDTGFRTLNPTLLMLGRNLGLRGLTLVKDVMLPAALPYLLSGLRIAWAFGWRTVVAAELVFGVAGAQAGIGWYINQARYFLETNRVFAALVSISAVGMFVESIFALLERRTIERWGMKR